MHIALMNADSIEAHTLFVQEYLWNLLIIKNKKKIQQFQNTEALMNGDG